MLCVYWLRRKEYMMELPSETVSYPHHVASTVLCMPDVTNSAAMNSGLVSLDSSCDFAASASKPDVIRPDSGVFTDRCLSANELADDASRCSSAQSGDRTDICSDKPSAIVRCSTNNTDRPTSALARGVQITEYPQCNPNPLVSSNEESLILMEEFLSPHKLVSHIICLLIFTVPC